MVADEVPHLLIFGAADASIEFFEQLLLDELLRYEGVHLLGAEDIEQLEDGVDVQVIVLVGLVESQRRTGSLNFTRLRSGSLGLCLLGAISLKDLILLVLYVCENQLVEPLQPALLMLSEDLLVGLVILLTGL